METIIDLVKAAKPNKCLLKGKILVLVEEIEKGRIQSKEDAYHYLFRNSIDPEQSLKKLLRRTKNALLTSIITSISTDTHNQKVRKDIYIGFAGVMLMLNSGKRAGAIPEARRLFNLAAKYEILHVACLLASKIAKNYAESQPNQKLFKYYSDEADRYVELIRIEILSNKLYSDAIIRINNRTSYSRSIHEKLEKYSEAITPYKTATIDISAQFYSLKVIQCFAQQSYAKAIMYCNEVLLLLGERQEVRVSHKARFLFFFAVSAIADKKYELADSTINRSIRLVEANPVNKQILSYYRAINAVHQGIYSKAEWIYEEIEKDKIAPIIKEHWAILNAYLHYINGERFRLGKFFNETLVASQDKRGMNINIIIADLLISLQQNRDRFLHRIEAVKNYRYRHLKGKAEERARFFLDLLFQLPRCDFDRQRVERATGHIQRKLERRSLHANHNLEIEIVPFEVLWNLVLERLETKRRSARSKK